MTAVAPSAQQVRTAMEQVLAEAATEGRQPSVSALARRLGIKHATFYRNYRDQVEEFKALTQASRPAPDTPRARAATDPGEIARLRRDNEELRRTVRIYAEAIRQLTCDNEDLYAQVKSHARVVDLAAHRTRPS